jgi:hypothetical protein
MVFRWDFVGLRGDRKVVVVMGTAKTRSTINLRDRMKVCMANDWEMDYFNVPE